MDFETDIKSPDSHLQVGFYQRTLKDEFKSAEETKLAGSEKVVNYVADYIKIEVPGNKHLVIDTPAREEHKKRFPMHWAAYQNHTNASNSYAGTPIEQWPRVMVNPETAVELRALKFNTVQAVAGASDSQLQAIGMVAGQNAFTFRDDARKFLATNEAQSKLSDADRKNAEADAKLEAANMKLAEQAEQHAKDMAEMKEQMQQLLAMAGNARKPGRPAKDAD
jgi:DNA anti-recombination protein RmuC